jgi:hypothetical protein
MAMQQKDNPAHIASMPFRHREQEHLPHFTVSDTQLHLDSSLIITSAATACSGVMAGADFSSTGTSFSSDIYIQRVDFYFDPCLYGRWRV